MQHIKPTPEKYCAFCGTRLERKRFRSGVLESMLSFNRRKYCDMKCAGKAHAEKPHTGKSWMAVHYHARKIVPPGPCVLCGKPNASDVHHKDGNPQNNNPNNLIRLCRSCHTRIHHPKGKCVICGRPMKGHGYCNKHLIRFRKFGNPLWCNGKEESLAS